MVFLTESVNLLEVLLNETYHKAKTRILQNTHLYVSTIDSTPRFVAECGIEDLAIHTIIIDEAACVLETAIPILLRWAPRNLVLIGDHLQLAPYTNLDDCGWRAEKTELAMMKGGHAR